MKKQLPFNFTIPVNEVTITSGNLSSIHHGDIIVEGVAYDNERFDINHIEWRSNYGSDLFPLFNNVENPKEYVDAAILNHIKEFFTNKNAA